MAGKKGSKHLSTEFFENSEQAKRLFEEFKKSRMEEKEDKKVNDNVKTKLQEGDLPGTGPKDEKENTNQQKEGESKQNQQTASNPADTARSLSSLITLFSNFQLYRQGRELVSDLEMETYAREITPFVTKYQHWLKYVVELQAVGATAAFVWTLTQKKIVDEEQNRKYKGEKGNVKETGGE